MMTGEFNNHTAEKFGAISNDELLESFVKDDDYVLNDDMMDSRANIPTEEIQFNLNGKQ